VYGVDRPVIRRRDVVGVYVGTWVTWTGGDPELVILVIAETLRSIADGLDGETGDAGHVPTSATS
jgi:hypothetical protein